MLRNVLQIERLATNESLPTKIGAISHGRQGQCSSNPSEQKICVNARRNLSDDYFAQYKRDGTKVGYSPS